VWKSVEDFVQEECVDLTRYPDIWHTLSRQGMFNSACNYVLKSKNDRGFPMFNKDRIILSFDNSIFCAMQQVDEEDPSIEYTPACHFMQYGSPELARLPARFGSANYIRGSIDPEWLTCDPRDIPTPVVEGMLRHQHWTMDVICVFLAICVGRVIFPIGTYDAFQVVPFLYGVAGTGKSTLLKLISRIYEAGDVYTMSNDTQAQFSLANAHESFILMITEVKRSLAAAGPVPGHVDRRINGAGPQARPEDHPGQPVDHPAHHGRQRDHGLWRSGRVARAAHAHLLVPRGGRTRRHRAGCQAARRAAGHHH
jgi:hypothetical protein